MSYVAGLLEERAGYVARGLANRVAQVDAELARLGYVAAPETEHAVDRTEVEHATSRRGRREQP